MSRAPLSLRDTRSFVSSAALRGALALLFLSGCGARPSAPTPPPTVAEWRYEVQATQDLTLSVEAVLKGPIDGIRLDDDMMPFVDLDAVEGPEGPVVATKGTGAFATDCRSPCKVRYRVRLAEAGGRLQSLDTAVLAGGAVFAPPSSWLVRPNAEPERGVYRFRVTMPEGASFASGVRRSKSEPSTYEASVSSFDEAAYCAFGKLRRLRVGVADVAVAQGAEASDLAISRWLGSSLDAVSAYIGQRPSDQITIFVAPGRSGANQGKTLAGGGPSVLLELARGQGDRALEGDWVAAHELLHVGLPALETTHAWFYEGYASYVEPVARVRAGLLTEERFWSDLLEGIPRGEPRAGDTGLEGSRDIDRIYWGGSLYFLLADIELRRRTAGKLGLEDAVRAMVRSGQGIESKTTLDRMVEIADTATGTKVFQELRAKLGPPGARFDTGALFRSLGIAKRGQQVVFDDEAELSAVRRAITARPRGVEHFPRDEKAR